MTEHELVRQIRRLLREEEELITRYIRALKGLPERRTL